MAKSLLGALLGFVAAVSLAAGQDKTSPAGGEKTGGEKTAAGKTGDAKAGTAKAGDAKTGDAKTADAKTADSKTADTKQPPKVHEKTAVFDKLRRELRETVERLGKIQEDYRLVKKEGRPALEEEFEVKRAHAKKLLPQVTEAAKAAIVVDPTDPEVMDYLGALAQQAHDNRSAHEETVELARLILDHQPTWDKFRRPELFRIGGVAAFYAAQFDTAEKYLKELEKHTLQDFSPAPDCREKLTAERGHWQEELERQKAEKKPEGDPQALPRVRLTTTQGDVVVELFENEAPNTVANFITLVEKKFYDDQTLGTSKIEITTGAANLNDKEMDYKIACEWTRPSFRRHFRGSLAMSTRAGKDTGCSEFSIWLQPDRGRDPTMEDAKVVKEGIGTVFGRVVSGLDVLSKVRQGVTSGRSSQPVDRIVHATVVNKRNHKYEVQKLDDKAKAETTPKTGTTPAGKTEPASKMPEKGPSKTTDKTDAAKTDAKTPAEKGK